MKKFLRAFWMLVIILLINFFTIEKANAVTNCTADEAITKIRNLIGNNVNGGECVAFVCKYAEEIGGYIPSGIGTAAEFATVEWKNFPDGWERLEGVQPQKGDILIYTGGYNGAGHVAVYESDSVTYHQNFSSHRYVECVSGYYKDLWSKWEYWGVIRPDFTGKPLEFNVENLGDNFEAAMVFKYKKISAEQGSVPISAITGSGNFSGANVEISSFKNEFTENQIWIFNRQNDGSYLIKNKKYNLYLDVTDGLTSKKTNIQLCRYFGGSPQRWYICKSKNEGYRLLPKSSTEVGIKTCLDIVDGKTANGTNVHLWSYEDFYDVTAPQTINIHKIFNFIPSDVGTNFDGALVFNYKDSAAITGMGSTSGANVEIKRYSNEYLENQIWHFERQSDGSYFIKNNKYNLYLDATDGSTDNLTNIQLCRFFGESPQRWYFCQGKNGGYRLIPKSSLEKGIATSLDINDGKTTNGTNVQLWEFDNINEPTRPQTIYLEKISTEQLGNLRGTVISCMSETDKINVKLYKENSEILVAEENIIGNNANFTFENLLFGDYIIKISKNNHVTREYMTTINNFNIDLEIKICLIGDINNDGKVNGKDWIRLYEHISETNELNDYQLLCADVNKDGKVNGKDWIRLYEHINETNPLF